MKKELKYKIEPLSQQGLEVYDTFEIWKLSEDKQSAYLALPGICISIRFYENEKHLNPQFCDAFVSEIQYDYKNPDFLDSYDFVKNSGTYGQTFFHKTIDESMRHAEQFINEDFEGVAEFHSKEIISTKKIPRIEVAKKAFLHHAATFQDLAKDRFTFVPLKKDKLLFAEYLKMCERYTNRAKAERKYSDKLDKIFESKFKTPLRKCTSNFQFSINLFERETNLKADKLKKDELKVVRKAYKYHSF